MQSYTLFACLIVSIVSLTTRESRDSTVLSSEWVCVPTVLCTGHPQPKAFSPQTRVPCEWACVYMGGAGVINYFYVYCNFTALLLTLYGNIMCKEEFLLYSRVQWWLEL